MAERMPEDDGDIAALLRLAGEPEPVPRAASGRVQVAVRAAWRAELARRAARRRWSFAAAAAAVLAGAALWTLARSPRLGAPAPGPPLATVQAASGGGPLAAGAALARGARVATQAGQRLALRLTASGASLRLDAGTELVLVSGDELCLEAGAIYVDTGAPRAGGAPALLVRTALGAVTDVGTQFEVRLADAAVAVRVREGRVRLSRAGGVDEAEQGTELVLDASGHLERGSVAIHGPHWGWTLAALPPLELQDRTLREFLGWAARESGWTLSFAEPSIERSAPDVRLSGSIAGLTPGEALAAVLPTCGLTHRVEDGRLIVSSRDATERGGVR